MRPFLAIRFAIVAALLACTVTTLSEQATYAPGTQEYLAPLPDPLESFNRSMHKVNHGLLDYVAYPVANAYLNIVPQPIRAGISNFSHNLAFPVRLVNTALQGKFDESWSETKRFGLNTTVGILGIMDPATKYGMPQYNENFKQTFGHYDFGPGFYLNLPILGPSSCRDAIGTVLDFPLDIGHWLTSGYGSLALGGIRTLSDRGETLIALRQFFDTSYDSYTMARAVYTLKTEAEIIDYKPFTTSEDNHPDQSLFALALAPRRRDFMYRSKTYTVKFKGSQRKFTYQAWPLPASQSRGILFLLPGLGAHRLSGALARLAELGNEAGYSVIATSSTMHPDFFTALPLSLPPPGNLRADSKTLVTVLAALRHDFLKRHPRHGDSVALLGYSLGGLNALYLLDLEAKGEAADLHFENVIAINPPRDPKHALNVIDDCFNIPSAWPAETRNARIHDLYLRLVSLLDTESGRGLPPMTQDESRFAIGFYMRTVIADSLLASQRMRNTGFFSIAPSSSRICQLEAEALAVSTDRYVREILLPAYPGLQPEEFADALRLDAVADTMAAAPALMLLHNENDLLITPEDCQWFKELLGDRAQIFPQGGHLGNIPLPEYQQLLLQLLSRGSGQPPTTPSSSR